MLETIIKEKTIIKKLIIAIVFVFLFNFTFGNLGNSIVFADEEETIGEVIDDEEIIEETGGGDLLLPLYKLFLFLSDSILELLQKNLIADMPVTIAAASKDESTVNGWAIFWIGASALLMVAGVAFCWTGIGNAATVAGASGLAAAIAQTTTAVLVGGTAALAGANGVIVNTDSLVDGIQGNFDLPTILLTPDAIFSNSIPLLDINFFNPNNTFNIDIDGDGIQDRVDVNGDGQPDESAAAILQNAVSSIYKTLRILAIVALLTVLVYIGIRMLLTSTAQDKAKYKDMLMDWGISLILVFGLHYLMAAIIDITQGLTNICDMSSVSIVTFQIPNGTQLADESGQLSRLDGGNESSDLWVSNFVGFIRFYAGLAANKGFTVKAISYTLMYMVLVIYIIIFTFQYLKRVIYMAFLTMISPIVAITYPIDKINDGKAQGFNTWLREYIFNALLQPIHYIIYVIVIGSVMQLVVDHPVYGIVALGFMVPAEKFIRKLFGFEKASTVGGFGAAAGAAALMGAVRKLTHRPHLNRDAVNDKRDNDSCSNRGIKTIDAIPKLSQNDNSNNLLLAHKQETEKLDNLLPAHKQETKNSKFYPVEKEDVFNSVFDNNKTSKKEDLVSNRVKSKLEGYSIKNGVKALKGHYKRRMIRGMGKIHPVRALRRGLTYGIGAATLGTIGLAAGIASGDPSKALQYTVAGGMVGGNLGKNLGETASNAVGVNDALSSFRSGALGDRYDEKERKKYNRDFKNNVSNYDRAVKKVNLNGWKDMSKDGGIIDSALDYGINDINAMCNIYKTQQKLIGRGMSEDLAKENAFRAYKLNSQLGDYSSNSKTQENLDKILDSKGYSDTNKIRMKNEILDLMEIYKDISKE